MTFALLKMSKRLTTTLLLGLCLCLMTPTFAARQYNNGWRSMPFIEMMVTMMKVMNQILGGNNSFTGMNALPYSTALMPGMMGSGLGGYPMLPMSSGGMNTLPLNNMDIPLVDSFQPGQDTSNFWDPNATTATKGFYQGTQRSNQGSMNGIWQALTGDVIAIYNNNKFIWSDGGNQNLAGQLSIKGNKLIAYVPSKKTTLYFQFYREPGQFIVRDQNARVYTFKRIH